MCCGHLHGGESHGENPHRVPPHGGHHHAGESNGGNPHGGPRHGSHYHAGPPHAPQALYDNEQGAVSSLAKVWGVVARHLGQSKIQVEVGHLGDSYRQVVASHICQT